MAIPVAQQVLSAEIGCHDETSDAASLRQVEPLAVISRLSARSRPMLRHNPAVVVQHPDVIQQRIIDDFDRLDTGFDERVYDLSGDLIDPDDGDASFFECAADLIGALVKMPEEH